jgi:hypothetical protein
MCESVTANRIMKQKHCICIPGKPDNLHSNNKESAVFIYITRGQQKKKIGKKVSSTCPIVRPLMSESWFEQPLVPIH